jgi:putative ABC transport system permease protein
MENLTTDIRYGIRSLLKRPVFTLVAVVTLALGLGASTAIFSVVNAVLIRPLPYKNSDRIVWLSNRNATLGVTATFLNEADILDYRDQARSFEQIAAWGTLPLNLYGAMTPERVEGVYVTTNFFQTLGVTPVLGRDFTEAESHENSAIISYSLWQRQFGGDKSVIGRKVNLGTRENQSSTIVGVVPAELNFPEHADLFMTSAMDRADTARGGSHNSRTIARLRPSVTIEQAQSEITALARRQAEQFPDTNAGWDVTVVPLREYLFGSAQTALPLLFGAVVFVLFIACANVTNLQLGRAVSRRKEIAVRLALGAGRWRIMRQSLTESLLLAMLGSGLGLLLAQWGLVVFRALGPESVPRLTSASINGSVLAFAVGLTVLTGFIVGLVPALQASRSDIQTALKDGNNLGTTPRRSNLFRRSLVIAQMSLALVLLVGAGLLIRSFWKLQAVTPGFQTEHVLNAGLSLSFGDYPNSASRAVIFQQATEKLAALPGVVSVGAISHLPFGGRTLQQPFSIKGQSRLRGTNEAVADYRVVTPSFFETLRIPLRRGRWFDEHDTAETPQVFVINEAFARTYFPGVDPIGARFEGDSDLIKGEIVGVVGDVKHRGLEAEALPTFYVSYRQSSTFPIMNFLVRSQGDPAILTAAVQRELQSLDARAVVFKVRPFEDFVADSVTPRRFNLWLLGTFAVLAVILAVAGIYGTMSYAVAQRTREVGIRVALGAEASDVLTLVVGEGMKLIVVGVGIGLVGAFALTRWMKGLLFAVGANDPLTFVVITVVLMVIALVACWVPARRAAKVDPLVALRYE